MKSKKNNIIIPNILSFILGSLFVMIAFLFNNNIKDEKIKKEHKISTQSAFAIMVQNEDKTGYIESTSNIFPSDMTLNEELTNCTDENGTKVENALTYQEGNVIVETNKKIYCYLYFDANASLGNGLIQNPTSGLNTTLEGGLYRYQGASGNVDNYVCFGISDKDICLGNTDVYLYRIIGINEDGKVKVIKNYALNSTIAWDSRASSNIMWANSELYNAINSSSFLSNISYMPSGWSDKIETTTWKYGDDTNVNVSADALYNVENAWAGIIDAKIGLIYAHDYYYAYQSKGLNCSGSGAPSTCKNSWIHLSVNDTGAPSASEWIISRLGLNNSYYNAWFIDSNGSIRSSYVSNKWSIRPVFFLKSDIQLIGGTGKSDDPFIIK